MNKRCQASLETNPSSGSTLLINEWLDWQIERQIGDGFRLFSCAYFKTDVTLNHVNIYWW